MSPRRKGSIVVKTSEEDKLYCRRCQRKRAQREFYQASNPDIDKNGFMSICKDCIGEIFNSYMKHFPFKKSVFLTCQDIDLRYNEGAVSSTVKSVENAISQGKEVTSSFFGVYKKDLFLASENYGFSSFKFKDSDRYKSEDGSIETTLDDTDQHMDVEYMRRRWGDLPIDEVVFLEDKYNEWVNEYEVDAKNRRILVESLVWEELYIRRGRATGNDVSKNVKTIQDLLKSSNLSPRQAKAAEEATFKSFPDMIAQFEQSKPCYIPHHKLKDIDNYGDRLRALAGLIARTAGKPNEDTKVFERLYAESTLDFNKIAGETQE